MKELIDFVTEKWTSTNRILLDIKEYNSLRAPIDRVKSLKNWNSVKFRLQLLEQKEEIERDRRGKGDYWRLR